MSEDLDDIAGTALDVLLEIRDRPIGAERHVQLQQTLAQIAVDELANR